MLRPMKQLQWSPLTSGCYRRSFTSLLGFAVVVAGLNGLVRDTQASAAAPDADQAENGNAAEVEANLYGTVNNMKQIMIAMQNFHDAQKTFPAAFSSQDGKPPLSWRVALLPYFESEEAKAIYADFDLDEPWDSEHNKELVAKIPQVYQSPASKLNDGRTVYLTPRGAATAFPGQQAIAKRKIVDGISNTIAVLEVDDKFAVPWTKPDDWKFDPEHPKVGLGGQFSVGFNAASCQGSIHFVGNNVDDKVLKALFTMAGGEIAVWPDE